MDEMAIYSGYLPIQNGDLVHFYRPILGSHVRRPRVSKKQEARSSHSPPEFLHGIWKVRKWPIIVKGICLLQFAKNEQNGFLEGFLILSIYIWEKWGAAKSYV